MKQQQRHNPLRNIAEAQLHIIFGDRLSSEVENELATALVRQWTSYDGYAGLLADSVRFWFHIKKVGTNYDLSRSENQGCVLDPFIREKGIDRAEVPFLLHRLNVAQSVAFENVHGERLRLSMNPMERTIAIEELLSPADEP